MLDVGTGGMLLVKYPELVKYERERESCCQGGKVRQTMKENEGGEGGREEGVTSADCSK